MSQLTFWIVSADTALAKRWETVLSRQGWQVSIHSDATRFSAEAQKSRYGIVLFDWDVGRARSSEIIRQIKSKASGLSFILTSDASLGPDKVIAILEAGADDHFLRAIDDKLLVAKLKAHLRRLLPSLASALEVIKSPGGELKIDRSQHEAWVKGTRGRLVPIVGLTRTEFQLLTLFLEQPGKVLERRYIMETIWRGEGTDIRPGTVDKHVESLRRKLGKHGPKVKTIYGVGYAFRES
jgi:DNA-binding response OmpR family regulator